MAQIQEGLEKLLAQSIKGSKFMEPETQYYPDMQSQPIWQPEPETTPPQSQASEQAESSAVRIDPQNPFENPMEQTAYNGDYRRLQFLVVNCRCNRIVPSGSAFGISSMLPGCVPFWALQAAISYVVC